MIRDRYNSKLIGVGFAIVIATMISFAIASFYYLGSARDGFNRVISQHNVQLRLMNEFLRLSRERSLTVQHMLLMSDPFELDEHQMKMGEIGQEYLLLREKLFATGLDNEEREIIDAQHIQTNLTGRIQNRIAELIMNDEGDSARELFYEEAIPNQHMAMRLMGKFIALQYMHNSLEMREVGIHVDADKRVMLILMVFGSLISIGIAIVVTRKINHEIDGRNKVEDELEERVELRTEELTYIASHDVLTALPNRAVFNEQLQNSVYQAKRYHKCAALLFLDLDGFKDVNDSHGHMAGDHALVVVADRVKGLIRNSDIFSRVGGDEFTIVLNDVSREKDVIEVCNKIIQTVNLAIIFQDKEIHLGVSIGVTFFMNDKRDADQLLTEADDAMYVAKARGKNGYHISKDADREGNVLKFEIPG